MTRTPPDRPRPALAITAAVVAMALVLAADIAYGERQVLVAALMVGPMLAVLGGRTGPVALLGVVAVALAIISPIWNENFGEGDWAIRISVVALGSAAALVASRARAREIEQAARMRLLAELGEMAGGVRSVRDTATAIAQVLAPSLADVATVDVLHGDIPERLAAEGDPELASAAAGARPPAPAAEARRAEDAGEAAALLGLNGGSPVRPAHALTVPLQTRGGSRGALTLATLARPLRAVDLEFARVAAGRAALALDNAGLSSELAIVERQLAAALTNLAEAVTVQDAQGRLVYANQAAADLLGYATADDLVAQTGPAIVRRFNTTQPDGRPLDVEKLPGRRVLLGEEPEPLLVRARDADTREERWRVVKASAVRDDDGAVRYAVNVIEDVTETKRAEAAQRLLAEAGRRLAGSLDARETLQHIAEVGVPELADSCAVHLADGPVPAGTLAAEVLSTGRAQLVPDVPPEAGDGDVRSAIAVPMQGRGEVVGVITFRATEARPPYDETDLQLALELGRRAGSALVNARLYAEQAEIARALQEDLLPPELPDLPGFKSAALYHPAGAGAQVGGDFYDVFEAGDGWIVVVGDVAGRGPSAASLTAMARYTLRTALGLTGSISESVALLNAALYGRSRMALCSVCMVHLHGGEREGQVSMLAAGHPDPYVIRAGQARSAAVGGPLLGALSRGDWPVVRLRLEGGDTLVLYTDGVIDTQGEAGRFGERRLGDTLQGTTGAADAVQRVRVALEVFASGRHRDDTAVLAVERRGVRETTPEDHHRLRLTPGREAPSAARQAVGDWLAAVLDEDRLADVRLLVSELVTNGVVHGAQRAGDSVDLDVIVDATRVRVDVRNPGPAFDAGVPTEPPPEARGGRGLLLVGRVASRWGVERGDRTCVWFEIDR